MKIFSWFILSSALAVVSIVQAKNKTVYPVVFIAGITGTDPNTARELVRGIDVFKKSFSNDEKRLDIKIEDNQGDLQKTQAIMNLYYKKGVRIFIGVSNSNEAMVAAKFISEHKDAIFITPFATNPNVTKVNNRVFRTCFDDISQGSFIASYIKQNFGDQTVAILKNTSSLYSQGLANVVVEKLGPSSVSFKVYDYTFLNDEFSLNVDEIIASKPKAIFIPDASQTSAKIVKQFFSKAPQLFLLVVTAGAGKNYFMQFYLKQRISRYFIQLTGIRTLMSRSIYYLKKTI